MNSVEASLVSRLRDFALSGSDNAEEARKIIGVALGTPDISVATSARVADVMERYPDALPDTFAPRLADFMKNLASRIELMRRLDSLGDPNSSTRNVLDFAAIGEGQLEISSVDFVALRDAQIRGDHRPDAAKRVLDAFGWERVDPTLAGALQAAVSELSEQADEFQAEGLFVDESDERGYVLGLQVRQDSGGDIKPHVQIGHLMRQQADIALHRALPGGAGAEWNIEWPLHFDGASIGLALYVAALVARGELRPDPLLAATGEITMNDRVSPVRGIPAKLEAARRRGIRRVLLPEGNRSEAERVDVSAGLKLMFVSRTGEITAALAQLSTEPELIHADRVVACRRRVPLYGLRIRGERDLPNAYRFEVGDGASQTAIDVFTGPKGTVKATGKENSAKSKAQRLVDENFALVGQKSYPSLPFNVPDAAIERRIDEKLVDAGAARLPLGQGQSLAFRLTRGAAGATVIVWASGRAVLQAGKDPAYSELHATLDQALAPVGGLLMVEEDTEGSSGAAAARASSVLSEPHIGTDESGKGDYFGPLVSAAVYADEATAQALIELGVRDSKRISDKAVRKLASDVKRVAQGRYAITRIGPTRFNSLFTQMRSEGKNMNTLLAWGHSRSIEDLLNNGVRSKFVVVDQFADARYMEQKILADTRESGMEFVLFPKAEADVTVAAASILARDNFLDWLEQESRRLGIQLPKGASDQVVAAAREIVARFGEERLRSVAKMSFKTTEKVLAA